MNEESEVLKLMAKRLDEAGLSYMISGSMAVNYYAVPRMTRDIDIVIVLEWPMVEKFVALFRDDFYVDEEAVRREVQTRGMFNLIHREYVVKLDFIVRKDTEFQRTAFDRRRKVNLDNSPVWLIAPEDLILAKLFWARDSRSEMQLKDVANLLKRVKNLDIRYLEKWIETLGLKRIYGEVKKHA